LSAYGSRYPARRTQAPAISANSGGWSSQGLTIVKLWPPKLRPSPPPYADRYDHDVGTPSRRSGMPAHVQAYSSAVCSFLGAVARWYTRSPSPRTNAAATTARTARDRSAARAPTGPAEPSTSGGAVWLI